MQTRYKWLPFAIVGVLVAVGIGLMIIGAQSPERIGPRLQVDREQIDFGDQHFDTTVRATFNVKNTGDGTLQLEVPRVATAVEGCWPGSVVVGQTTLQPGQSTTLYTDFMMHEGMGGPHLFEIPLKTNDPTQQVKNLRMKSNWVP